MWLFLSRRFRTWMVLAVTLPLARMVARKAAAFIARRYLHTSGRKPRRQ